MFYTDFMAPTKKALQKKISPQAQANENGFLTFTAAAAQLGIAYQTLQQYVDVTPPPAYLRRIGNRRFIDPRDPDWQAKAAEKGKSELSKMETGLKSLQIKSLEAKLHLPIQKAELNRYKIEQERLVLEKESRHLIEMPLAEYLYTGYMERVNREILNIPKRISKEIEMEIQAGIHGNIEPAKTRKKIVKLITREHEAILRDVVTTQKKELAEWESENE